MSGGANRILVKLGGTLLDEEASRNRLATEIAQAASGHEVVVVHGGGKQMTRFLAERGIESRFVNGLRVTTPETVDAVLKVFAGSVNHALVASFVAGGAKAVGLSGIDAALAVAEQMDPALGAVGRIVSAKPDLLELLTGAGYLPVVACVAGDGKGQVYNVNADQMAAACAVAFRADHLVFLTDVAGVLDASKSIVPSLTPEACDRLIAAGVATGGMQAKLNAAMDALKQGVKEVVIAPGAEPEILARLLAGETIGSRLARLESPRV